MSCASWREWTSNSDRKGVLTSLPTFFWRCIISSWLQGRAGCPPPTPAPFHTYPHSHMISGRSSLNNLFSSAFPVFAACARRASGQYESLHSDFMGWIFGELMNILFFTLERIKTLVLCKLWTHLNLYSADYGCWSSNSDNFIRPWSYYILNINQWAGNGSTPCKGCNRHQYKCHFTLTYYSMT